ncbi:hypothetical protein OZK63_40555, partial [Streptomyces sp. UMAF16]|nr:hypothetical protein [Streptomyces sp. UMAF16]
KMYFEQHFSVAFKSEGMNNLVTEVDTKSEVAIIDVIKNAHPMHAILSEEAGALVQDSNYKWIIDPIDGTINYANGIPICCISIAIEKEGEMILGAVL